MGDRVVGLEQLDAAHEVFEPPYAEPRHDLPRLLGHVEEEVDDVLGLAAEALSQHRILGRDADGARVEVAGTHHHAAARDERRRREADLVGAEKGGDDDVAARLQLTVGLHPDTRAEVVANERLLGLGEADLPRDPGEEDRRQRRGAGAAVVARDQHEVGVRLGNPGCDRADADLRHELHGHASHGVRAAEVVDQLLQILDRVDVVVRRRRNQPHPRRRQPHACDVAVDLVPGQLAALAGLRALGHLDLELVGVRQVVDRDAEAAGGDLFDRRAARIAVGVGREAHGVLAALAGVRAAADAVHRDRERLVRLTRDRPERHRPGHEPLHDLARGLDLVERHTPVVGLAEPKQPAQRQPAHGVVVDGTRVRLVGLKAPVADGVLEQRDRLGVPLVVLAVTAPGVEADDRQQGIRVTGVRARMPQEHLAG